jgi:glyoxylase-like metal-dependent hydrolase (beta-lactamase superfamily II)
MWISPAIPPGRRRWYPDLLACFVAVSLFLVHAAGQGIAQDLPPTATNPPPLIPRWIQINPGLYLLGGSQPSAAYAVETSEGLVLIDSGLPSDAKLIQAQLDALGLDWKSVRAVLITHAHADHSGGAQQLRTMTGAKVYAGLGDAGVLRAGGPREALFSAFSLPEGDLHPTTIDVELKGGEVLAFGDVRFHALATPGHTPGSICYLMERGQLRALFGGDVISMLLGYETSHVQIEKPLGTYSTYLAPRYRGDARAYLASLRMLRAIPVPDLVLPGHPRSDPAPQDPRLSQERWEAMLDRGINEMVILQGRYEADGADFLDGTPRRLLPDLYYLGDFHGDAVYALFAGSKWFLVNAPGGPGLLPFVRDRLRQLGLEPAAPYAILLMSSGAAETAGLRDLVEACHPQVYVSPAGLKDLERTCPPGTAILSAEELPARGRFAVLPIPLRGRGAAPIAYRLRWAGKTVLLSGRIPIKANGETDAVLLADLSRSRDDTLDYLFSVYRLGEVKPDLWLPAVPVDGQNANLYDSDWQDVLDDNYRIGYRAIEMIRRGAPGSTRGSNR